MFLHRDYHAALDKLQTAPLTLTERDFDVLHEFNPADEVRGRAAVRQAQLAIVTTADVPLETKAADPPPAPAPRSGLSTKALQAITEGFDATTKHIVALHARVKALDEQARALRTANSELRERVAHLEGRERGRAEAALEQAR